jgi:cytosine/adenosine deaminase-related metal-dependent hydrolase
VNVPHVTLSLSKGRHPALVFASARAIVATLVAALAVALSHATPANAAPDCYTRSGNAALLIKSIVLARSGVLPHGQVLINAHGKIECAGSDCSTNADAAGASVVNCPTYVLSPGLINTHDHISFTGDAPRKDTGERFMHRHEWRIGLDGHHAAQGEDADHDPRVIGWGELRFLAGGTTSIVGGSMAPGLVRNLDHADGLEGLAVQPVLYKVFPLNDEPGIMRTHDCNYGPHPSTHADVAATHAFLAHVAEGRNAAARNEFRCESSRTYDVTPETAGGGTSNDWIMPQATLIHAVGLQPADLAIVAQRHAGMVWSPRSNLALYGKTMDVLTAHRLGITIALGSDWLPSGSMDLNRELVCAKSYDLMVLHGALSNVDLWKMVTIDAASVVHDAESIGSISPHMTGDVALFMPRGSDPYAAVVDSSAQSTALVVRGGRVMYGAPSIVDGLRRGCSTIAAGGTVKRLCGEPGRASGAAMQAFARRRNLYPVAFDGTPRNEPACAVKP